MARLGLLVQAASRWHYVNEQPLACDNDGARFIATDHTRPFDPHRVPALGKNEGFFLRFAGDFTRLPFSKDAAGHELQTAAPVYYDDGELLSSAGKARFPRAAYITYWFFYAYNKAPVVEPASQASNHQGDWEDMSLYFEQSGDGSDWVLHRIAYAAHGKPTVWVAACAAGVEPLTCPAPRVDWQGTTRLVGYVAKGDHGTYPSAGKHHVLPLIEDQTSPIGEGFSWPTWQMLVPLESQPWAGFCGAWGKVGKSIPGTDLFGASERTGPLGPGCLAGGQRQYKTGRPRPWGASRSSPADRAAQVGTAVGVGL